FPFCFESLLKADIFLKQGGGETTLENGSHWEYLLLFKINAFRQRSTKFSTEFYSLKSSATVSIID
ncbi:hypothetical protein, partial [Serratia marcescens]|uniref:hypothetical protein n=1 Tax=Serratia marcescens TaxID=615 RepID=UPI002FDA52C5